jgi:hypothetical protein
MRIIFLCGSLESGKDGVGDYCQRIAVELVRRGYVIGLLALCDVNLNTKLESELHFEGNISIPSLRLPFEMGENDRFNNARNWIEVFNPEWISLQFVIFSFHPKGLPFGLSLKFLMLRGTWRWHIMFHELWLGLSVNQSVKYLLWGRLQRKIIEEIISVLNPSAIHTHTRLYQTQLQKLGYETGYLPLFGNIPFSKNNCLSNNIEKDPKPLHLFKMVIFGAIHKTTQIKVFANEVAAYARKNNKKVFLTIVGNSGAEKENWEAAFHVAGLPIESLGSQTPENISGIFDNSDAGISTYTIQFAEKSGTIAAMREHGLPILCVSESMKKSGTQTFSPIEGVFQYQVGNFGLFMENAQKHPSFSNLEYATEKLICCFNNIKEI